MQKGSFLQIGPLKSIDPNYSIFSLYYVNSDTLMKSKSISDIISPEGIAIDWISRRIYWTDSAKDTIEVASLDDSKLRSVIAQGNLVNPRGIAIDPHQKYE